MDAAVAAGGRTHNYPDDGIYWLTITNDKHWEFKLLGVLYDDEVIHKNLLYAATDSAGNTKSFTKA